MALKKSISKTVSGFEGTLSVKDAYWKIVNVSGDKEQIDFVIQAFNGEQQVGGFASSFTPSVENGSENFIRQAYIYLKTLPEFENAEDC